MGADNHNAAARYSPPILVITAVGSLYPLHRQDGHEIIYVEHGQGTVYACGYACKMQAGDLLFVNRSATHGFAFEPDARCVLAGISCSLMPQFTELVDELRLPFYLMADALQNQQIDQAIGPVVRQPCAYTSGIKLMSAFGLLLDALATQFSRAPQLPSARAETFEDRFAAAAYIEVDAENPSLDRIASALGISRSYASRSFKRTLGLPLPTYSAVARTNAARRLLIQTEKPVKTIADLCHYESLRTFNRQFKEVAGMTATAYRASFAPSHTVNYDLPRYRPILERFYEQLDASCPSMRMPVD